MEAHKIDSRAVYALENQEKRLKESSPSLKRPPEFPGKITEDMPDFYPWWDEKINKNVLEKEIKKSIEKKVGLKSRRKRSIDIQHAKG